MAGTMKPSAWQPPPKAKQAPGYATDAQTGHYEDGQRDARTALRRMLLGLAAYGANLTPSEMNTALLDQVHRWMFDGKHGLELNDDDDTHGDGHDDAAPGDGHHRHHSKD